MAIKVFIGLACVVIIGQNNPSMQNLAMHGYFIALAIDGIIYFCKGVVKK